MRMHLRPVALATITLIGLLTAAPAYAATGSTGGSGSAVTLTVGGQDNGTGTYSAQYDGQKTTSGNNQPAISVLGGQSLIGAGTLAQDADADANGSRACAGLAGRGATLAKVGDGDCLRGGDVITLDGGHADLSKLSIDNGAITSNLPAELTTPGNEVLGQITAAATTALQTVLTQLGNPALSVNLGVVEGDCRAGAGGASGETRLANADVVLTFPQQSGQKPLTLLTLPAKPAPNSDYSADLGELSKLVLADLRAQLTTGLAGALGPAAAAVDQAAVINGILTQVSTQLRPVTGQVISVVANGQSRTATSIDLTALDLRLLPGAVQGADAFRLRIGHVTCGPTTQAVVSPPRAPSQALPTAVSAGQAGPAGPDTSTLALGALALLALASVALAAWRGTRTS